MLSTLSVFHLTGCLRLPSQAAQPLVPKGKLQALPKAVSRAYALLAPFPPVGRAAFVPCYHRAKAVWALPGCLRVAGCCFWAARRVVQKESRQIWEEAKSESEGVRQEHSPSW